MADSLITALTAKATPVGTEEIPVNDAGADKKITVAAIAGLNTAAISAAQAAADAAQSDVDDLAGQTVDVVVNQQTGTSYTPVAGDAFGIIEMNNALANTVTIPPNSSVAFGVPTNITICQTGAGQTTIAAGSGVTITTPETLKIGKQYGLVTLVKVATNTWRLDGNLEAA